jgi:hypothetical protein
MSGLTKGKHIVQDIDGVRCTVVEGGVSENRMMFIKGLLEGNKYEVKTELEKKDDPASEVTYLIGVTDILFNPVIAIYARKLKLPDGLIITPAYWNHQTDVIDPRYWRFKKK